jgi:hypothetical protein
VRSGGAGPVHTGRGAHPGRAPSNRYDSNAIAVYLRDGESAVRPVGHLSREDAIAYRPVFAMIGQKAILAPAKLKGGWVDGNRRGSFGVTLNLGTPAELPCYRR